MDSKFRVVIPSYKRPNKVLGYDYFQAEIVVPESQASEYRKNYDRVIAIPDSEDGNIARKRNWILKNIPRPFVMVDDDVKRLVYKRRGKEKIPLSGDEALAFIERSFLLARDWGCCVWGLNVNTDGRNYQEYRPFSLSQVVLGPFTGHWEHDIFNDERMGTKDDYDFALQVLRKYNKILRINRVAYDGEHGDNEGGIVSMRSIEREIQYCRAIERKWGRGVISYPLEPKKMVDLLNGKVKIPIKGV